MHDAALGIGIALVLGALALRFWPVQHDASRLPPVARSSLRFSVVDIAGLRYFDARAFPADALRGFHHVEAAKRSLADDASGYVWVLPAGFGALLDEAEGFARHLLLTRLRDPIPRATPVFVFVDGGAHVAAHDAAAKEAGVELLVALPEVVGDADVRALLDRAAGSDEPSTR